MKKFINILGDRVNHKDFGWGTIVNDKEGLSKSWELLVRFDELLPRMESTNENRCFSYPIHTDIVEIKDLTNIKIVWCRRFIDEIFNKIIASESCLDYNIVQFAKFQSAEQNQFLKRFLHQLNF